MTSAGVAPPVVDLARPQRIHVVGVGGAGMSAIASVLVAMGHDVSGSDLKAVARPRAAGRPGRDGRDRPRRRRTSAPPTSWPRPSAMPEHNPEVRAARARGIPVVRRAEILAAICATRRTLAVAGTARQDDHLLDAGAGAGGGGPATQLHRRWRRQRDRRRVRVGPGRAAGRGGRRERRHLHRAAALGRPGHQRRGRPPRPLRDGRARCGTPSAASSPASRARGWSASTCRGAPSSPPRPGPRASRCAPSASRPRPTTASPTSSSGGSAPRSTCVRGARRWAASSCRCRVPTTPPTPPRRRPSPSRPAPISPPPSGPSRATPAWPGACSSAARPPA